MTEKTTGKSDYKKSFGFKLEIIVFAFILVYLIFYIIQNFKTEPISGYQVKNGMLSENRIYNGIAIREEVPVYSEKSGYINFFVNEGERAAFNNLVYCIDESGRISNLVGKSPIDSNSLNEAELRSLKQEIQLFSKNFTEENFLDAPVFEDRINNELRKIQNRRIIDDLSLIEGSNDIIDYYTYNIFRRFQYVQR